MNNHLKPLLSQQFQIYGFSAQAIFADKWLTCWQRIALAKDDKLSFVIVLDHVFKCKQTLWKNFQKREEEEDNLNKLVQNFQV